MKHPKLKGRVARLASKYIAQEVRTGKYPLAQAQAIGISRAKKEAKSTRTYDILRDILGRY